MSYLDFLHRRWNRDFCLEKPDEAAARQSNLDSIVYQKRQRRIFWFSIIAPFFAEYALTCI